MEWHTVESVAQEAWTRLLEYANPDLAYDALVSRHGPPSRKDRSNYRKQARQIRASILQARDYFQIAAAATLVTSPNHLYYGMTSLASAIMLTLGDGTRSLDALRSKPRSRHHGLDFTTRLNENGAKCGLNILSDSFVEIRADGFFPNWYTTLPNKEPIFGVLHRKVGPGIYTDLQQLGSQQAATPSALVGTKSPLLAIIRYLPDLLQHLARLDTPVAATRCDYIAVDAGGNSDPFHQWYLHAAPSAALLREILAQFRIETSFSYLLSCTIANGERSAIVRRREMDRHTSSYFPAIRYTTDRVAVMYAEEFKTHEIVDAFLVGYALSMLARYYADLWVGCLESHCKAGRLIDRVVDLLVEKFPVMTLEYLTDHEVVISRHAPFWHAGVAAQDVFAPGF